MALPYSPRFVLEYNYASGDENPKDGRRGTFDPMYPTAHDKYGLADQVGWRNIHDFRTGTEFKPSKKWLVSSFFHDWWLASPTDALYATTGLPVARSASGTAGRHVGEEIDAQATYTFDKQLQVGGGFGHIFPGEFLRKTTQGNPYNFPYVMVGYAF